MKKFLFLSSLILATTYAASEPAVDLARFEQQKEVIKRQEAVFTARQKMKQAAELEAKGDASAAQRLYRESLKSLTAAEATRVAYVQASLGLARCNVVLAKQRLSEGALDQSRDLVDEALKFDPNNSEALQLKTDLARVKTEPTEVEHIYNPALTSSFKKDVHSIEDLFKQSEQYRRTGQFDKAVESLHGIIAIDPYNKQAFQLLEKINQEKLAYAEVAREQTNEQRMNDVIQKWKPNIKRDAFQSVSTLEAAPITRSNQFQISEKIKNIIIPVIDFKEGTTIEDAVSFLNTQSKTYDKDKKGITFIIKPEVSATAKPLILALRNVPVADALRYICQLAGVKFKIEEFAVFIIRLVDTGEALQRRQFNVSPDFFPTASSDTNNASQAQSTGRLLTAPVAVAPSGGNTDVKESLTSRGVEFPPGSSAFYIPSSGVLSVTNTQDQLDLIEELVNATSAQALMVDVQTKIVEVNQEDLNELTFNYGYNPPSISNVNPSLASPGFQTALRGSQGILSNNLDQILRGGGAAKPHLFSVGGFLSNRVLLAVVSALAQKRSTDLLSSPSVRVKSGDEATIKVARTFFYPSQYDAPQLVQLQNLNQNGTGAVVITPSPPAAIPAFPSEFESTDIGVNLRIRPQVGSDNRTIDLSLIPEVVDFEGFINYGTPITVPDNSGTLQLLTQNPINTPVFNRRKVQTKVFVRDGFTVVLGGLVREDFQEVNDKVPFLGDLPLIGRAFRSKATKSVKKNLLIMTSARILRPDGEPLNVLDDSAVALSYQ